MAILCLGEAIVDLICETPVESIGEAESFKPHFGGASANVAMAAARAGAEAALAGGAGEDDWGRWLCGRLESEGVDLRWFSLVPGLDTPMALITFDWSGESSFAVYGEGIEAGLRSLAGRLAEALGSAEALVFGSNTLVGEPERQLTLEARRLALSAGIPVLFDPNLRLHRWREAEQAVSLCRQLSQGAHLVRANREEARLMTGESDPAVAASALCRLGCRLAVVTRGGDGAVMRGEASAEAPGVEVEVASTLGAGDAFMGTLAAGLAATGWIPERAAEALPEAVAASARACTHHGAQP